MVVRQQDRKIIGIRAYEEPLEVKKNGRLFDYMMLILNNLLKRKMDFTFLFVLWRICLGLKCEIIWKKN